MAWRDWIRTVEVEPSLYAADFANLGEQVEVLLRTGARIFHFDVGDGHFVPPITTGPIVLHWIAPLVHQHDGKVDVHLMVDNPERHFAQFAEAGANSVTFHYEAVADHAATASLAREHGLEVGLSIKPATPVEAAAAVAGAFDLILVMSVEPGYSGQEFMPDAVGRVRTLRSLVGTDVHVQVDGGIGPDNIRELYEAGADLFVAGSSIFGREDLPRAYRRLVQALA